MPRDVRNFVIGSTVLLVGLFVWRPDMLVELLMMAGAVYVVAWSEMWSRRRH
jgi:hypothetical protein